MPLPALPKSWMELTWQQLCTMWDAKIRFGGNPDVARVAAFIELAGLSYKPHKPYETNVSGEVLYTLCDGDGGVWVTTPRELAYMARTALPWFDYPYGDQGEPMERDAKGKVIKERRDGVKGYVSPMQDAMILPEPEVKIGRHRFALPQAACHNLTWQQYRAIQNIAQELYALNGSPNDGGLNLQSRFLAHILTPRSLVLFDNSGGSVKFRPHFVYAYDPVRAEHLERWWQKRIARDGSVLFHVCFQTYQTALSYYSATFPFLFTSGKSNVHRDALSGEVGTINAVMKYAGYSDQQNVYDANLPFILDILNTMAKEAEEIEKMNAKVKKHK